MKNANNIILGLILIVLGLFALAMVNEWIDFKITIEKVAQYWPFLLILAGVLALLDKNKKFFNSATLILIILAIPFSIFDCSGKVTTTIKDSISEGIILDGGKDEDTDEDFKNGNHNAFLVEDFSGIETVKLNITGGGASYRLNGTLDDSLFLADTHKAPKIPFSLKEYRNGSEKTIDFKMKRKNTVIVPGNQESRKVTFKMNPKPIWDINLKLGAIDLNYDLSDFKVSKLKIESGASKLRLKLGNKLEESEIKIESGVADIQIEIPENVGCEITVNGALNGKIFDGFSKEKNGVYKTGNFETADQKIFIEADAGISNIRVTRY